MIAESRLVTMTNSFSATLTLKTASLGSVLSPRKKIFSQEIFTPGRLEPLWVLEGHSSSVRQIRQIALTAQKGEE